MVLLDQIVEIFRGPDFGSLAASMFAEDFPGRPMRSLIAIKRDGARQPPLALERPTKKRLGGCDIPLGAEEEIHRLSFLVDSAIEVGPAAFDLYIGLVDAPRGAGPAGEAVPALFEFRNIARWIQRMIVVCARDIPRSAIISTRSRKLSLNRRYHRTQTMMLSRSKWRPLKRSSMLSIGGSLAPKASLRPICRVSPVGTRAPPPLGASIQAIVSPAKKDGSPETPNSRSALLFPRQKRQNPQPVVR
jgi:hypothetical protein